MAASTRASAGAAGGTAGGDAGAGGAASASLKKLPELWRERRPRWVRAAPRNFRVVRYVPGGGSLATEEGRDAWAKWRLMRHWAPRTVAELQAWDELFCGGNEDFDLMMMFAIRPKNQILEDNNLKQENKEDIEM